MPIYDNDGTTAYQTAKLYDNDGTTAYQTAKAYDNDGTTSSLIYTAEENVFQHGVSHYGGVNYVSHGNMTADSNAMRMTLQYVYGSNGGIINAYTNEPFDLSGVDKLTFTALASADATVLAEVSLYVGVVKSLPKADGSWLPSGWQHAGVPNSMRVINAKEVAVKPVPSTAKTYTLDVSALSGAYYITLCGASGYGYHEVGSFATVDISNVILS